MGAGHVVEIEGFKGGSRGGVQGVRTPPFFYNPSNLKKIKKIKKIKPL